MLRLGLAFLHKWDAGSAVRLSVAIENGEVHERAAENVSDDRGERLSAVDMRKASVTGKAGGREPHNAADGRKDISHAGIPIRSLRMPCTTTAPEMKLYQKERTHAFWLWPRPSPDNEKS